MKFRDTLRTNWINPWQSQTWATSEYVIVINRRPSMLENIINTSLILGDWLSPKDKHVNTH